MKYLLSVFFLLLSWKASSQFTKGDKFVSGSFGVSDQRSNPDLTWTTYSVSPSIASFVNEKWAAGGSLSYNYSINKSTSNNALAENERWSVGIGLTATRFISISEKFYFSLGGSLNFSRGTTTSLSSSQFGFSETKRDQYSLSIYVNLVFWYFPSSRWGFQAGIGNVSYSYWYDLTQDNRTTNFNFYGGNVSLGFAYFFRRSVN